MKKRIAFCLALALILTFGLTGCGNQETPPAEGTPTPEATATPPAEKDYGTYQALTGDANRVANYNGDVDTSLFTGTILVTSFGQSADGSMLNALMKKTAATFDFISDADADTCAGYNVVLIACGASTKGLGAAGISESAERERAEAIQAKLEGTDTKIIAVHLGGSTRRGALSDGFTDYALAMADYIIAVEEGNTDFYFHKASDQHQTPLTLIYLAADATGPLTDIFGKAA